MNNKVPLESLSMDLLRVALGLYRGSVKMAEKFSQEAAKRKEEIEINELKPYMQKVISNLDSVFKNKNISDKAEHALMYSTLIRNYCQKYL